MVVPESQSRGGWNPALATAAWPAARAAVRRRAATTALVMGRFTRSRSSRWLRGRGPRAAARARPGEGSAAGRLEEDVVGGVGDLALLGDGVLVAVARGRRAS